jgi:PAS domain S-box-containing protein
VRQIWFFLHLLAGNYESELQQEFLVIAMASSSFSQRMNDHVLKPSAIAGFFVIVALLWTFLLQQVIAYPFVFLFLGAVMGSAWWGGFVAGFIAVFLSSVLVAYFSIPPLYSISVGKDQTFMTAFIACSIAITMISSARRRAENAVRRARDELEVKVQKRTSELLQSNLEILERERQLRQLTEAIPQQIWSADLNGRIEYCNHDLLEYVGKSIEELRGEEFFSIFHPEDGLSFRAGWKAARSEHRKFELQARIKGADGIYRWFLIRSTPQRNNGGEVVRWYGVHIDMEEQKCLKQDLECAQENLSRFSRTLSMAEMAASIAHELNQPLTALVSDAAACRRWLSAEPANLHRATAAAERIAQDTARASSVVSRVHALFSQADHIREATDLNALISELFRLLRDDAIRRGVSINLQLAKELPKVQVDPVQIQQLLMNLAVNGMDAMMDAEGLRVLTITSRTNGPGSIVVCVRDCGPGIGEGLMPRIFEPFFTTKPHGIGMGLAICRSIIETHGGAIRAENANPGAAFYFTLRVGE